MAHPCRRLYKGVKGLAYVLKVEYTLSRSVQFSYQEAKHNSSADAGTHSLLSPTCNKAIFCTTKDYSYECNRVDPSTNAIRKSYLPSMNPSTTVYQPREAPETSHEANKYSQTTTTSPPHPNEPPPSYDDATNSTLAPLLVGPPPNYGTQQAYTDADESSMSSHPEESTRVLPEWIGQGLVVLCFLGLLYGFWNVVNEPDSVYR